MLSKFRKNYNAVNVTVKILFVLAFCFANWQSALAATLIYLGQSNVWLAASSLLLMGTALTFLLSPIVGFVLNVAKIHSVPVAEYCLIAQAFFTLGLFIRGLLNIVNFFTPLFYNWGGALFPFIATLAASLGFYSVTSRLYFNDVTRLYYFKVCTVVFFAVVVIMEVLW